MKAFFYAIGDLFQALFPAFKAIGASFNIFWILFGFVGLVGWVVYMQKNKDAAEKLD